MDRRTGEEPAPIVLVGVPCLERVRALRDNDLRRAPQEQLDQAASLRADITTAAVAEIEHRPRPERTVPLASAAVDRDRQLGSEHARLTPLVDPRRMGEDDLDLRHRAVRYRRGGYVRQPLQPAAPVEVRARAMRHDRAPRGDRGPDRQRPRGHPAGAETVVELIVIDLVVIDLIVIDVIPRVLLVESVALRSVAAHLVVHHHAAGDAGCRRIAQPQRLLRLTRILDLDAQHPALGAQIGALGVEPRDDRIDVLARDAIGAHRARARGAQPVRRRYRARNRDQVRRRPCPEHARLGSATVELEPQHVAAARVRRAPRLRRAVERRVDPGQQWGGHHLPAVA
jgi:hypothetical protein